MTEAWNYMLGISDNKREAEVAEDLGHQFVFLAKKMGDGYQTFANLVKSTWKSTSIARDTMAGIVASLRPHIIANKRKSENRASTLEALEKHWGRVYYEQFYQMDEVISPNKFFQRLGIVVWQYQGPCKIIAIWAINNFTAYKILTACVGISSDTYRY